MGVPIAKKRCPGRKVGVNDSACLLVAIIMKPLPVIVTAAPNKKRGERLIVLHTGLSQSPKTICARPGPARHISSLDSPRQTAFVGWITFPFWESENPICET